MHNETMAWRAVFCCMLFLPLTAFSETASDLERFERSATHPHKETTPEASSQRAPVGAAEPSDSYESGNDSHDLESELISMVVDIVGDVVSYPGIYSWQRVTPSTFDDSNGEDAVKPRSLGEGLIPFARFDASYNRINSHISAVSGRAEIGYGPFGFEVREAHYSESEPSASLDVTQYHVLYRMSLGDNVEMDLGLGSYELSGVSHNSGNSSTIHLLIYPTERLGIELRPSWASINGNSISDHEVAINYGDQYWSARVGYHWLESPAASLNGPFIGLSLRL